ncbi:hypothetical protein CSPAE12_07199, partial [Colletotrichum incanum]
TSIVAWATPKKAA